MIRLPFCLLSILVAGCSLIASSSFAATNESSAKYEKPDVSYDDSSYGNREGKHFELAFQPVGFAVDLLPSFGFNLGFYVTPDVIIEGQYSYGSFGYSDSNLTARTFAVDAKVFLRNSLYLRTGLIDRQIIAEDNNCFYCSYNQQQQNRAGYAYTLGAEVAVGNQWQWEHFTLGCDWLGVVVPLTTLDKDPGYYANNGGTSRSTSQLDQMWEHADDQVSIELLRFYLGASF